MRGEGARRTRLPMAAGASSAERRAETAVKATGRQGQYPHPHMGGEAAEPPVSRTASAREEATAVPTPLLDGRRRLRQRRRRRNLQREQPLKGTPTDRGRTRLVQAGRGAAAGLLLEASLCARHGREAAAEAVARRLALPQGTGERLQLRLWLDASPCAHGTGKGLQLRLWLGASLCAHGTGEGLQRRLWLGA